MYPNRAHADWNPVLRFLLLGPITGILVGYAQVTVAVVFWVYYGQPDFYFRGRPGVEMSYLLSMIGGGFVGIIYGSVLLLLEHLTRRRIQPLIALALVIVLASGIAAVITAVEFQKHEIGWIFAQYYSAVVFGFVASFASSTRDEIGGEQSEAGQRNEVSSRK